MCAKPAEAIDLFLQAITAINLGGHNAQAKKQLLDCAALVRAQLGDRHMYLAFVLSLLADVQEERGHFAEAEKNYRDCLEIIRVQVGLTHPRTHIPLSHLAHLLRKRGRKAEAEELFRGWLDAHRARRGPFLADALTTIIRSLPVRP